MIAPHCALCAYIVPLEALQSFELLDQIMHEHRRTCGFRNGQRRAALVVDPRCEHDGPCPALVEPVLARSGLCSACEAARVAGEPWPSTVTCARPRGGLCQAAGEYSARGGLCWSCDIRRMNGDPWPGVCCSQPNGRACSVFGLSAVAP